MKRKKIKLLFCATLTLCIITQTSATSVKAFEPITILSEYGEVRQGSLDTNFEIETYSVESDKYARIQEADTKIAMSATISTEIKTEDDLNTVLSNNKIGTAILSIDNNLNVIDCENNVLGSLSNILSKLEGKVIPTIRIENPNTVTSLSLFLNTNEIEDIYILSSNSQIIKSIRELCPITRGIIDFNINTSGDLSTEELMEIVGTTNRNSARVALLPEALLTRNNVEFLQKKLITVWGMSSDDSISAHKAITSGVNGVISQNTTESISAIENYNNNTTIIRHQFVIGHRGIPSLAPENTMSGYKKAYELGADVLETDIYLTRDNEIVIMHDSTLDRTTTGTGKVEDYTLAELKEFYANDQFPEQYPDERIPSLKEMLDEFKDKGVDIFIEIKSYNPEIVPVLVDLLKEKDMLDQVSIITFSADQAILMRDALPEISVGYLSSAGNTGKPYEFLRNTLKTIQPMGTTFNTSYSLLNKEYLDISKHRGLTMWPWTYRTESAFSNHFALGIHGLTTDYTQWASDKEVKIDEDQSQYNLNINDIQEISAIATNYQGDKYAVSGEIVVLEGQENLSISENTITAINEGTAYIQVKYTADMLGKPYDLYTQPIKVYINTSLSELTEVIKIANGIIVNEANKYTEASIYSLKEAVKLAEEVLVNENATQEQINRAKTTVENAIAALEEKETNPEVVDKTALKITIDYANELKDEGALEGIVPAVVKEFDAALASAESVYGNTNATETEVKAVFDRLAAAIHMLAFTQGDKSELENLINAVNALNKDNYTEESWANLEAILAEATKVIADENAMQEEVNEMADKLQQAVEDLDEKADKSALENLVEVVEGTDSSKYIPSTWKPFTDALNEAQAVLSNANATQEEVDQAYDVLLKSYLSLRLTPDKSLLQGLIKEVEGLDLSKYTAKSAKVVEKSLEDAKKVLNNEEATQEEVDSVLASLKNAKNSLVTNTSSSNSNNNSNTNNSGNTSNENNNKTLPKTGSTEVVGALIVGITTLLGGIGLKRKRK